MSDLCVSFSAWMPHAPEHDITDDELHRLWIDGQSLDTIAATAGTTKKTIGGRVRRLRRLEGLQRWPYHG